MLQLAAGARKSRLLRQLGKRHYKYRQVGLAVSIGLIGLLTLPIYLKLRQKEK